MRGRDRYEEKLDRFEPEYDDIPEGDYTRMDNDRIGGRLSRRDRRRKRKLEARLRKLQAKEARAEVVEDTPKNDEDENIVEEPRRRSHFVEGLMSFLSGNILSHKEVSKTYPYLVFVAFLMFLYIGNIFSMQHLHRRHNALTKEVRELRTKSMTLASERMQATRQSNIVREIEKRGLQLKESTTPNKVIPK